MLPLLVTVTVIFNAQNAWAQTNYSEKVYYTREIIESEGYKAETHHVTTNDGYILELHRIPFGKNSQHGKLRPAVFLMHGILGASNSFIYLGPKHGLAYNLADAGFDVWMGNARGTRNSRRHVSLDPERNKLRFFDFSFEEIALHDLPTMIDYVLEYTGQQKLHYVGHSQGGTVFLVLNSMKAEYNAKFASTHLLAAIGYQTNFPNSRLRTLAFTTNSFYKVLRIAGNVELFPPGSNEMFGRSVSQSGSKGTIGTFLNIDTSSGLIAGAALKQIAHFGQNIRDRSFRRWDYGRIRNFLKYKRLSPPSYDLSNINIDITLHYSLNDTLLSEHDALLMARDLPNGKARKIANDSFAHLDYVIRKDAKELVTDYIIESLQNSYS